MNKRGISPLIASVLLIAFTIILFTTITLWIRNSAVNPAMQETEDKIASDLEAMGTRVELENAELNGNNIKLSVSNIGSTLIKGFSVRVIGNKGVDVVQVEQELNELDTITRYINFDLSKTGSVEKIEVVPLLSSGLAISATSFKEVSNTTLVIEKSCLDIIQKYPDSKSGNYLINPTGNGAFEVYCNMESDGGGWTLAAVCRPEDNPNYPNYNSGVPASDCWNTGAVESVLNPISTTSVKLSDAVIKSILSSGEKTTRGQWIQQYRYDGSNPLNQMIYNKITDPSQWSSSGGGTTGKEFYVKYNYGDSWGSPILTQSTGCSSASNGWSNQNYNGHGESCGQYGAWDAGCERAPSSSHCCACVKYDERANIILWIK